LEFHFLKKYILILKTASQERREAEIKKLLNHIYRLFKTAKIDAVKISFLFVTIEITLKN